MSNVTAIESILFSGNSQNYQEVNLIIRSFSQY